MEGDRPQTWKEGLDFKGPSVDPHGRLHKHELRVGEARSLADLQGEYVFFTPAVPYLLRVLDDGPLCDMMWELRTEVPFFYKKFTLPLFRRLDAPDGDADWNYALWALRHEHWDYFLDFYCSVAVRDHARHCLHRVAAQRVLIADPLASRSLTPFPPVEVTAFGLNGSSFIAAFEQWPDPRLRPPTLRFYPPDEGTRVFARALGAGLNPHDAEEQFTLKKEAGRAQA